jgi:hypothetical protein
MQRCRSHSIGLTRMRGERAEWNDQIVTIPGHEATLQLGAAMRGPTRRAVVYPWTP